MPKIPFKKGNPGKPKGAKNKTTFLKHEMLKAFERNRSKGRKLLNAMFDNKQDFKWLMELQASLEPKEISHYGEVDGLKTVIVERFSSEPSRIGAEQNSV